MPDVFSYTFHMLIFPGGIFALCLGLLLKGVDRKVFARLQRRVGPPIMQPFFDIVKLGRKESILPASGHTPVFRFAPIFGFMGMLLALMVMPVPGVWNGAESMGDMLMMLYLLPIPAIALMLAGSSSSSPYGTLGSSREMMLMFAYEIPLLAVILTVAFKVGLGNGGIAEFSFAKVVEYQQVHGSFIFDWTMLPAFFAYLLFLPGTLGTAPFDLVEAETELLEGPLLEYSGPGLAMFSLCSALKMVLVMGLGVVLFFPGTVPGGWIANIVWFGVKCMLLMLFSITLVRAATGRLRADQSFRFYLKYPSMFAYASLALIFIIH